jgi:hypothetical protein
MKILKENIGVFIVLGIITFGIFWLYWMVKTKSFLNSLGGDIPTSWLIIIPIANFYWLWKYCSAYNEYIRGDNNNGLVWFLLWIIISPAAIIILQLGYINYAKENQL